MEVGDRIALPPEPPVGTRLGVEGVDRENEAAVKALDLVRKEDGWFYVGFLHEDGTPHDDKWGEPVKGWAWDYVIGAHSALVVIEVP